MQMNFLQVTFTGDLLQIRGIRIWPTEGLTGYLHPPDFIPPVGIKSKLEVWDDRTGSTRFFFELSHL